MATIRRGFAVVAGVVVLVAMMAAATLTAAQHGHDHGTPEGHGGHALATPDSDQSAMTGTGVVYMTITNEGDVDDELVGATTDRAQMVEVHEMVVEDEVGRMVPVDGPLEIPAGESVALEPGGLHVMLIGLTDDIRLGDTFDVTFTFAEAGEVTIPVTAVLDAEDAESEPVTVGDLTIEGAWSRPAPKIDGASGTPAATPGA